MFASKNTNPTNTRKMAEKENKTKAKETLILRYQSQAFCKRRATRQNHSHIKRSATSFQRKKKNAHKDDLEPQSNLFSNPTTKTSLFLITAELLAVVPPFSLVLFNRGLFLRNMKTYEQLNEEKETSDHSGAGLQVTSNTKAKTKSVDEVMEHIGVGKFQYFVFLICGISFMADAVEVSLLSFLAECLEVEWSLTDVQKSSLTSIVFVGQLFGSYFWGPFADKKVCFALFCSLLFLLPSLYPLVNLHYSCLQGRKKAYLAALSMIVVAGYGSAFARDFPTLVVTRFFVGFGVGAIHIPFDIMAEFLPSRSHTHG
jgi:hypothetical protein